MSSADKAYADAEAKKVHDAAKLLNVADDIVLSIESLVDLEAATAKMRRALFHVDTL